MPNFLSVEDEHSWICGVRIQNKFTLSFLSLIQLGVTIVSFGQHVFSYVNFHKIFLCSFNETVALQKSGHYSIYLSADVIIFDFRLFHELIHVNECIANHLDGGYMRCLWCASQIFFLTILICLPCIGGESNPLRLWPVMIMQNCYCFGLMILQIATADKFLMTLIAPQKNPQLVVKMLLFLAGTLTNHFLNYVLWHYYWFTEVEYKRTTGKDVIPFWV